MILTSTKNIVPNLNLLCGHTSKEKDLEAIGMSMMLIIKLRTTHNRYHS